MKTWTLSILATLLSAASISAAVLNMQIVDQDTGKTLAGRVYIEGHEGQPFYVESSSSNGSALRYEKRNWVNKKAEEFHTTVSAHAFQANLKPGRYEITIERGKEYFPLKKTVDVGAEPIDLKFQIKRWINMAERGWYSGETHVHRTPHELSNLMQAEDLNVSFPLTYWVTKGFQAPATGDKNQRVELPEGLVKLDETHVFWPRNTEWEIFSINGERHTLGAVFALGHQTPFQLGVPPIKEVARLAAEEGALLDLDKHDWPWSMILPPVMGVQLYELANNHMWRTEFGFTNWNSPTPEWMRPRLQKQSGNERHWIEFTHANYHMLLNCGLKMVPTAGTANGVHPVPLGFSRAYVHLPDGFSYEKWKQGLTAGRSFITTGPMVFATLNKQDPGHLFRPTGSIFKTVLKAEIISETSITTVEIIRNGLIVEIVSPKNRKLESGAFLCRIETEAKFKESGWLAFRCWEERPENRVRFAHTAPWHINISGKPLRPRLEEKNYLIQRVKNQIERSQSLLPPEALTEYREALEFYQELQSQ